MAVIFRPGDYNLGNEFGKEVRQGLDTILQRKQKEEDITRRKGAFKQGNLPEWLAELPDNMQTMLLKEYQFLPEQEKQQVQQQLNNMTQQYWSDWNQPDEQGIRSTLMGLKQANPQGQDLVNMGMFNEKQPLNISERSTIPGMNTLAQAGDSFTPGPRGYDNTSQQMIPREGTGDQGAPSPSATGVSATTQERKRYRMVPREVYAKQFDEEASLKRRSQEHKSVLKDVNEEAKAYTAINKSKKTAERMLEIAEKYGDRLPSQLTGAVNKEKPWVQALTIKDPIAGEYLSLGRQLIGDLAYARKGVVSNYKLKLEEAAKIDPTMPIETQISRLKSIVDSANLADARQAWMYQNRDKDGYYSSDIMSRLAEFDRRMSSPFDSPDLFEEGSVFKGHVIRNGQWVPLSKTKE